MTAPTADEAVAGYDGLQTRDSIERLRKRKALSTDEVVATLRRFQALRVAAGRRDMKRWRQPRA